jgi:hypothetical protein
MAISAELCNPTPFDTKLNYDRGVKINIPAFGSVLVTHNQMQDYGDERQPGFEAIKEIVDYYGLFIRDTGVSYDVQAINAINASIAKKKYQYDQAKKNILDRNTAAGIRQEDENIEELLKIQGYVMLREQIDSLREMVKVYQENNEEEFEAGLDPELTVFTLEPPRQFPSKTAKKAFLKSNPEVAEKELQFIGAQNE